VARGRLPEALWVVLCLLGLAIIVDQPRWGQLSFYLIWVSFALLYGLRAWHAHRSMAAAAARSAVSAENERLLAAQRRFLMDASHQLKTPITIALGHAELLARDLSGQEGQRDIHVVVGELNRLKSLSERLLLIAASENPDFLRPEPLALPLFAVEQLRRWRPAATRHWLVGQLDHAVVAADSDRLALALDALLENAVQHTADHDLIRVSVATGQHVVGGERATFASVVIEDSGTGIPEAELAHIFDRFSSGRPARDAGRAEHGRIEHGRIEQSPARRGTGLGLALAQAIASGHGGEVRVTSELGAGSRFEVLLPVLVAEPATDERSVAEYSGEGVR
jgi:signal transduction histidine kinase